jgi:preprotein translocase subunit Sss1
MTPMNVFLTGFLLVFVIGFIIKIKKESNINTWWDDDDIEDW